MSNHLDPAAGDAFACDAIDMRIIPRAHDLGGGFVVRRALPSERKQMVGPFIFLDQMGPADFGLGEGVDVRPHPHIGLSTLTYLYDGEIMHRDSLGLDVAIRPGAVNLMVAGRGIVHSERSSAQWRGKGGRLAGLQMWMALPEKDEETAPDFRHVGAEALPEIADSGVRARIVAGAAFGATSPLENFCETVFVDFILEAGAKAPIDASYEERALYISSGSIAIEGDQFTAGQLVVLKHGAPVKISATAPTRLALLGGAAMDGPRYLWWNFVSSRKERIEEARADWRAGRFAPVPGDTDFIPLPE